LFLRKRNLTILLALLATLLTATALLAALLPTTLASGLLLLLTGLLLAALLTALLAALLLLPALLHITHFVVRHGELSFAEGIRGTTISLRRCWFPPQPVALGSNAGARRNQDQSRSLAQIFGMRVYSRIQRPQNELPAMAKRHPHSGTITPQSGPDRRSLLMGTVSSAATPMIARAAHAPASPAAPSTNADKPADVVQMSGRSTISCS
jgi:hypothetical protein